MLILPESIFTLLVAKRKRPLTEEEELIWQAWIEENPAHSAEAQRMAQLIDETVQAELSHSIDVQSGWKKVDASTRSSAGWKRRKIRLLWRNIAAVLFPLACVGSLLVWKRQPEPAATVLPTNIVPGSPKAELILAGGETIRLDQKTQQKITNREGHSIGVDSANRLVYSSQSTRSTEWHTLRIPQGGEYQLTLPDGSEVWLNSASELHFPVAFNDNERRVTLKGEAYFEVKKSAQPFIVSTEQGEVRVLGTRFNLNAYPDEQQTVTTLVEGAVEFRHEQNRLRLQPGEQAVLDNRTEKVDVRKVNTSLYTSWVNGIFEYERMPLSTIMRQLARWYDIDYRFEDREFEEHPFTGIVRRDQALDKILGMIGKTTNVSFEISGKTIYIKKQRTI